MSLTDLHGNRIRWLPIIAIGLPLIAITLLHFATAFGFSRLHTVYRYFYFFPIVYAALRRVVRQAAKLAGNGPIEFHHLPAHLTAAPEAASGLFVLPPDGVELEQVEQDLIRQALEMAHHNKTQAARLLGISCATLLHRLDKYAIEDDD